MSTKNIDSVVEAFTSHDLPTLATLPLRNMRQADTNALRRVGVSSYRFWIECLTNPPLSADGLEFMCNRCPNVHRYDYANGLNRLVMVAGEFYIEATREFFRRASPEDLSKFDYPGTTVKELDDLRNGKGSTPAEWTRHVLNFYTGVLHGALTLRLARSNHVTLPVRVIDDNSRRILAQNLLGLFHVYNGNTSAEGTFKFGMEGAHLCRAALSSAIHLQLELYNDPLELWSQSYIQGPFSSINLPQLQLLAERSEAVAERLSGSLEKVFEQQLALLVQSFGFYVVSTRTGERSVDLLCISSDPTFPYSFLLEAKTSKTAYSLPAKDERALIDYARQVRQNLTTLPALAFILIVGPDATSALKNKIRRLELDNALPPVRFCKASTLANLREKLVGPPSFNLLRDAIISSEHVIPSDGFAPLLEAVEKRERAQAEMVRAFLNL